MAGLLAIGAGAGQGFKDVAEQMLKERAQKVLEGRLAEETRHNTADEGLGSQRVAAEQANTDALNKFRILQFGSEDASRKANILNQTRDDIRQAETQRLPGTDVPTAEADRATKIGLLPSSSYQPQNYLKDSGQQGPTEEPQRYTFTGFKPKDEAAKNPDVRTALVGGKPEDVIFGSDGRVKRISTGEDVTSQVSGHYEKPPTPDRVLVQTQGPNGDTVLTPRPQAAGKEAPLPGQTRVRLYSARQVSSHIDDTIDEIDAAAQKGLLGPLQGRWAEFLRGDIGSTGDPENDNLLNSLRTDLKMMGSGTVMTHFGGRGGQQLIESFNNDVLNAGKMTPDALKGSLHSLKNWLGTYANKPPAAGDTGSVAPGGKTQKIGRFTVSVE